MMRIVDDPLAQAAEWLAEALALEGRNHDAMALATAGSDGRPDVRYVLLKRVDADGLQFFTNRGSSKGGQLRGGAGAAAALYWPGLDRQMRVRGGVEELPRERVAEYFATRSRASQIGAWASRQSETLGGMEELRSRVSDAERRFEGSEVPLPEFWAGYLLRPLAIEFWAEGEARLHERIVYERGCPRSAWRARRLFP